MPGIYKLADKITQADIARVLNWAHEGREQGSHYQGMSYEDGILNTIDWLFGDVDEAPDT